MMMMALTYEVSKRLASDPGSGALSYFFCQSTHPDLNNATSILRGLIYLLIVEQKALIRHLRKSYDEAGDGLFKGPNALYALWKILFSILEGSDYSSVYLMIDALDECHSGLDQLLDLITCDGSRSSTRVKWLVSSRNEPAIKEYLVSGDSLDISLEVNSLQVSGAVKKFIEVKVGELVKFKQYQNELRDFVGNHLLENADGTFLWVALVCKELKRAPARKARSLLQKIPAGLQPLYQRMMDQLQGQDDKEDVELCEQILRSVTLAFRPLHLKEVASIANLSGESFETLKDINELVQSCGSFLTIREEIVYFVHQSAKDFFDIGKGSMIFHSGQPHAHSKVASQCLQLMSSTLKRDIAQLGAPGVLTKDVQGSRINLKLPNYAQYACLYWVDHLEQADHTQRKDVGIRDNGQIHLFLQRHFLHWLEALSLMRRMSEGVLMVTKLGSLFKVSNSILLESNLNVDSILSLMNSPL